MDEYKGIYYDDSTEPNFLKEELISDIKLI